MVQDPTTGEWRNAEPGEIPEPQSEDPNVPGPPHVLSNLLVPNSPGPTLDPDLLDPNSPGPSVTPNLLDPSAPGETIDPALLAPMAPGHTLEAAQVEYGVVEPSLGVAEPTDVTDHHGFTDPSLTEPASPEPRAPDHGLDDHQPGM